MRPSQHELLEKRKELEEGGGERAVTRQHKKGKHTARERLSMLYDEGTFTETGAYVKHRCVNFDMDKKDLAADGVVTGHGRIGGRLVYAYAQDFTVAGGSLGEMHAKKIMAVQEEALRVGAPIIGINDSGGARIQEGVDALAGYGSIFFNNTKASGVIPQISVIMGPCAGGAVYSPALTDFTFMVDGTSQMFITGPQVVEAVMGEKVTAEKLGGAETHNRKSGCAHFEAKDEEECFDQVRKLLSFLPQNADEKVPQTHFTGTDLRRDQNLDYVIPDSARKGYDMRTVIRALSDAQEFFEVQEKFAQNVVTGFVRIGGESVGIVANQPNVLAGCLDIDASDKAARFIRTCDAFGIPLFTLVDVPGYLPGTKQEYGGIIRHGAKLLYAYSEAQVPKVTLITRKAYGGAYIGMCSKHLGADVVFSWPDAEIAVMGADGAANIIFSKEIKAAEDPDTERKKKTSEYRDMFLNPYAAASRGYIDDILIPHETRDRIRETFETMKTKRRTPSGKRHGNIPL